MTEPFMLPGDYSWDFFISYAGPDRPVAESLCNLLEGAHCKVFLNTRALSPGDNWLQSLPQEQSKSRVTVVLTSRHTTNAYFQNEEVLNAIRIMRAGPDKHRIVPIVLGGDQDTLPDFPLLGSNAEYVENPSKLSSVVPRLLEALRTIKRISWQDYEGLFRVNDYGVAYIPLINNCARSKNDNGGKQEFTEFSTNDVKIVRDSIKVKLDDKFTSTAIRPGFDNDPSCGLSRYYVEGSNLSLSFCETSYEDYLKSGEHLDDPLPDDQRHTFRDAFGTLVRENKGGYLRPFDLTNICGVGIFVISRDEDILIAKHSERSFVYPGRWTFSASGTMKWGAHPDPFTEVTRKCFLEIKHQVNSKELRMIGFGADARKLYFQFGFIEKTKASSEDIIQRSGKAVELKRLNFQHPEHIVESVVKNCWEPAAEALLLTVCLQKFGREWVEKVLEHHRLQWRKREMRDEWDLRASRPGDLPDMSVRYPADQLEQGSKKYVNAIMKFLSKDIEKKDVLEIGAGTGRVTNRLVDLAKSVTCLDLCERMIQRNKQRLRTRAEKVTYIHEFAQEYIPRQRHDAAICALVLIHNVRESDFRGLVTKMCECADVLFVCEEVTENRGPSPHTHRRTEEKLRSAFTNQGYHVERRREYNLFDDKLVFLKFVRGAAPMGDQQ